jgi:endonuclease YncB( thermonuclease family)
MICRVDREPGTLKRFRWVLAALLAVAAGGCSGLDEAPAPGPVAARLERVVDGDTVVVDAGGQRLTVRLLGIDTPETHGRPAECGGLAATRHLARIAPAGTRVRLATDPRSGDTRDRFGRLLAYVDSDRGDLGERQLRAGLAYIYRYRGRRFSRLDRYRDAEADARADVRATWASCAGDFHARAGR